jgi:DNA transformation protein and related proteins
MRNSKVRARIAAGKLRLRIRDLRNLGLRSERMLQQIGIYTAEELRRRGAIRAFTELKRAGITGSLNLFWAIAGALEPWPEGRHWREVARGDERLSLLLALEDYQAPADAERNYSRGPPGGKRRRPR